MKTQNFISKAAMVVVLAVLTTTAAPALAAGPGGGDSGSGDAMGGANATGNKTMTPGASDKAMANKGMMPAEKSSTGSTTGSGMGGSGTTESNPSNTK